MKDIVKRLKEHIRYCVYAPPKLLEEAAREIEELRSLIEAMKENR